MFLMLLSCSKDDNGGIGNNEDFLRVTIDGNDFNALVPFATTNDFTGFNGEPGFTLSVLGGSTLNDVLSISISNVNSKPSNGNYTSKNELQNFNNIVSLFRGSGDDSWTSGVIDTEVIVNFVELNYESGGRVSGTFSGNAINEETNENINFENGEFSVIVE